MKKLRFADFVTTGQCCHYAQVTANLSVAQRQHYHDFYELFWVISGRGTHQINAEQRRLGPDHLILVRDTDAHALTGSITIINIAFAKARWDRLVKTYGRTFTDPMVTDDHRQREFTLTPAEKNSLLVAAEDFAAGDRGALAIDYFLLHLLRLLRRKQHPAAAVPSALPGWLATALQQVATSPQYFQSTLAFAQLAGRCPEHLARAVRRWTGKTPTDIINEARLAYAARRLIESEDKIMSIAMECGINTLGHFYRLFKHAYGMSPQSYRQHHRSIVGR